MKVSDRILAGKKILFLSPKFFNYEGIIKQKLQDMGAEVIYFDERSVTSAFARAMLKIHPDFFWLKSKKYYENILNDVQWKCLDYIFVVKCDMFPDNMIRKFRSAFPRAKFCLYFWDSIRNMPGVRSKIELFDYVTSFDRKDCLADSRLHFRPLFFVDDFATKEIQRDYKYDVAFCGTIHTDRYFIINELDRQCKALSKSFYKFLYLQSNFIYYFYKFFAKGFQGASKNEFSFKSKSQAELASIENNSRIIVDIHRAAQTGLTMRTIEMLGLKKKLITTNEEIKYYDFYHPDNICVIDRNNPVLDVNFMNVSYHEIDSKIYKKYSLEQWILDVLGIGEEK